MSSDDPENILKFQNARNAVQGILKQQKHLYDAIKPSDSEDMADPVDMFIEATISQIYRATREGIPLQTLLVNIIIKFFKRCALKCDSSLITSTVSEAMRETGFDNKKLDTKQILDEMLGKKQFLSSHIWVLTMQFLRVQGYWELKFEQFVQKIHYMILTACNSIVKASKAEADKVREIVSRRESSIQCYQKKIWDDMPKQPLPVSSSQYRTLITQVLPIVPRKTRLYTYDQFVKAKVAILKIFKENINAQYFILAGAHVPEPVDIFFRATINGFYNGTQIGGSNLEPLLTKVIKMFLQEYLFDIEEALILSTITKKLEGTGFSNQFLKKSEYFLKQLQSTKSIPIYFHWNLIMKYLQRELCFEEETCESFLLSFHKSVFGVIGCLVGNPKDVPNHTTREKANRTEPPVRKWKNAEKIPHADDLDNVLQQTQLDSFEKMTSKQLIVQFNVAKRIVMELFDKNAYLASAIDVRKELYTSTPVDTFIKYTISGVYDGTHLGGCNLKSMLLAIIQIFFLQYSLEIEDSIVLCILSQKMTEYGFDDQFVHKSEHFVNVIRAKRPDAIRHRWVTIMDFLRRELHRDEDQFSVFVNHFHKLVFDVMEAAIKESKIEMMEENANDSKDLKTRRMPLQKRQDMSGKILDIATSDEDVPYESLQSVESKRPSPQNWSEVYYQCVQKYYPAQSSQKRSWPFSEPMSQSGHLCQPKLPRQTKIVDILSTTS